jgi:hypothetical protein
VIIPPAAPLRLLAVPGHRAGRSSRSGTSSGCGGRSGSSGCTRGCNDHSGLSSASVVCMLGCAVVGAAICLVPGHDLLVLRRIGTEGIAYSARRRVESFEVCRLAEASPGVLVCARDAIASLGGLVEEGACLRASRESLGEQLGGSKGGGKEGEEGGGKHGGGKHGGG